MRDYIMWLVRPRVFGHITPADLPTRAHRVPLLRGGDDLETVLEGIRNELAEANRLAAGGDRQAAARAQQLQQELRDVEDLAPGGGTATATTTRATDGGTQQGDGNGNQPQGSGQGNGNQAQQQQPVDELTRLRALERRVTLQAQAERIADGVIAGIQQERAAEEDQLRSVVEEIVSRRLSTGHVTQAVRQELAQTRSGSRFASPDADPQLLDHLAAGGEVQTPERYAHAAGTQGTHRGVQYMQRNHPLGHQIRALYRMKANRATEADRMFFDQCMRKALAEGTPSAGGVLVPLEYMPDVLELLRANAVVRQAAPQFRNFARQVNQLSVSSGSTAYYTPENAQGQVSELTFGETPILVRHNLMGLVPVSNILLDDAAEAENIVRQDMAEVMALREDLAFLRGTGSAGEPLGLRNKVGVTLDPIAVPANGFTPSLYDLRRIRARFRTLNVRNPRPRWFFNTAFITYLETLADSQGRPLLETPLLQINDDGTTGVIDGIPFSATNQIPANLTQGANNNATDLMLVDMNTVVVGTANELEIDVSTEATYWDGTQWVSTYQNNQSLFRGWLSHDIAAQRPANVIVQRGVLV